MSDDFIENIRRQDAANEAKRQAAEAPSRPSAPRSGTNSTGLAAWLEATFEGVIEDVSKTQAGNRNTRLRWGARRLAEISHGGLDEKRCRAALEQAAKDNGVWKSDGPRQCRASIESGWTKGLSTPQDLTGIGTSTPATYSVGAPPPPPVLTFDEIEEGFWTSRKSLETIYLASLAKMCAPWSVLACCAARALALVRPVVTLPDIIGGVGSLNWFGAITATSGGGKGAASATAKLLVKDFVLQRNTGSGEGMIAAYRRPATENEPAGLRESIMFMVDEIDSLTAQSKRNGATTMSVLRSAFSGETLGFSYVNKNTPIIESHSYRMTMIISVQPQRAADLLADYHGGTPQRFMWFPGTDKRVSAELAGGFVGSLTLPPPSAWQYPTTVQIPDAARDLILRERVKTMQGVQTMYDGHALFMREKFAFALAVLDGRTTVTQEDWELSGIAAKVSDTTRDWVVALAEEAKVTEATEKGVLLGVSSVAADEEKSYRINQNRQRVLVLVVKHLKEAGANGLTDREMRNKLNSRDRRWVETVQSMLREEGWARYDDEGKRWYTGLSVV